MILWIESRVRSCAAVDVVVCCWFGSFTDHVCAGKAWAKIVVYCIGQTFCKTIWRENMNLN
jgi:hypothetical protein